jgi:predicted dehydrogenase
VKVLGNASRRAWAGLDRSRVEAPVRVAVIGLGYWGPNLLRNLQELPGAEVTQVCDTRPESLDSFARWYPELRTTSSYEHVLADESIEAVVIATPIATHYRLAREALRSGKHVFVEKPLAGSAAEAAHLVELAQELSLVLMPGHTFLYSPSVNRIHSLIETRQLGDIYFVSMSRVNLGIHQQDVSVAWDLAPHDFSILRYWLGEMPTHLSAVSRSCIFPNTPDVAFINLEFPTGTIAHVELSWLAPSKLRRTTIVGSERMVVYDDVSNEPVRLFDSGVNSRDPESFGEYQLGYRTGDIVSLHIEAAEPLQLEMADFCTAVRSHASPRSSAALGLEVVQMVEAVEASLSHNGGRVAVAAPRVGLS